MFKITVQSRISKEWFDKYGDELENAVDNGLNDLTDYIATYSDDILRGNKLGTAQRPTHPGSFDTGFLARSQVVNKDEKLKKTIAYEAPYGVYIEFGTKLHRPPIKPIYDWIYRNREKLGVQVRTIVKSPKFGVYYREVMSFAWAIAMTIAKEGSEPKPFLRPSINMGKINANAIIKKQIGKWRRNIRKLEKEQMKKL